MRNLLVGLLAASLLASLRGPAAAAERTHDGYLVRLTAGAATVRGDGTVDGTVDWRPDGSSRSRGFGGNGGGISGELALGVPVRRVAVGGIVQLVRPTSDSSDVGSLVGFGPFVDYYPDPTGGFHAFGGVLLSVASTDDPDDGEAVQLTGPGATLGVGYDWFIGAEWSIGVSARVTGAVLSGSDPGNYLETYRGTILAPTISVAGTYH